MRRFAVFLMALLLATLARADGWVVFTAPDDSFSIEFPVAPEAAPHDGKNFAWQANGSDAVYVAGYSVLAGLSDQSEEDQAKLIDVLVRSATKSLKNVKARSGLHPIVEVCGTNSSGKLVQFHAVPAPEVDRVYVLMTIGEADAEHFFNSFELLGASDEGGD